MLVPEVVTQNNRDQTEVRLIRSSYVHTARALTHAANHCDVVVNTEKHFEYVKREGLCFNCLGKYRVSQCTSQYRCKKCNNKHHTSICGAKSLLPPMKKDNPAQSTETNSQQPTQKNLKAQSTETNPV